MRDRIKNQGVKKKFAVGKGDGRTDIRPPPQINIERERTRVITRCFCVCCMYIQYLLGQNIYILLASKSILNIQYDKPSTSHG